jgi:uncharacterized protein YbaR (Trm112 family)
MDIGAPSPQQGVVMALDKRLLEILCCPASRQPVTPLAAAQLDALREAQRAGALRHADGSQVEDGLDGGLITRDGRTVYPVVDGIPVMLVERAIDTAQVEAFPR